MGEVSDRWEQLSALLQLPDDADWLHPPVTDAQIGTAEEVLGRELPADLVELFRIHNGFELHNLQWVGPGLGLERATAHLHRDLIPELSGYGGFDFGVTPSSDALYVATAGQSGILYSGLEHIPGRLLWFDVSGHPSAIPLAKSIARLLEAYIAVAGAGLVEMVDGQGPYPATDPESARAEADQIFVDHNVAAVGAWTIENWMASPLSSNFSIREKRRFPWQQHEE